MVHSTHLGDRPPIYKIDLSLPPAERYIELASIYRIQLRSISHIFDDLVSSIHPNIPLGLVHKLARLCMRRLYTSEETEEIRGISKATDIPLHLLVAFNVLLDLLMGCTSGGVRVKPHRDATETKMLHFRTLDWGMDALRELVVQLDYVRGPDTEKVLARSITYVGFVGVLTGVRKDLSLSLNFRPTHNVVSWVSNFLFYANHLLVLFGIRPSIASLLRQYIVPELNDKDSQEYPTVLHMEEKYGPESQAPSLVKIESTLPSIPTTAAYLIFSDGISTLTMEKDYRSAVIRTSTSFIVTTNNDLEPDAPPTEQVAAQKRKTHAGLGVIAGETQSVADIIEDSNERRDCMQKNWDKKVHREQQRRATTSQFGRNHPSGDQKLHSVKEKRYSTRSSKKSQSLQSYTRLRGPPIRETNTIKATKFDDESVSATPKEAIKWLSDWPVTNETTHYAMLMDPTEGEIIWIKRYLEPVDLYSS
ncbi:hypothetical protein DTO166G4_1296 [Paecilomyces variotii]|nr:hypothetical protein DTO166G4_1296 [Paecilomyces variotii]KAJ9242295.1 hypothetical protein DTO166G5_698 [Paecilomyces variotii]KAJ9353199.1 hypothetical protein DTO027B9_5451 [Paecilomyces variotii]